MAICAICKAHGPHLPLCTDYIIADALINEAMEEENIIKLPAIPFGYFPGFKDFAGSAFITEETTYNVLHDIVVNFITQGLQKILILNLGYTTENAVNKIKTFGAENFPDRISVLHVREIRIPQETTRKIKQQSGSHADEIETSLMLHIQPNCVYMDRIPTKEKDRRTQFEKNCIIGDPSAANKALGSELFNVYKNALTSVIRDISSLHLHACSV